MRTLIRDREIIEEREADSQNPDKLSQVVDPEGETETEETDLPRGEMRGIEQGCSQERNGKDEKRRRRRRWDR